VITTCACTWAALRRWSSSRDESGQVTRCTVLRSVTPRPGYCHGWRLVLPACERYSAAAEPPVSVACRKRCSGRDSCRDMKRGQRAAERWDW
jgi:hypothetical protein